jgi:hypothetical protein
MAADARQSVGRQFNGPPMVNDVSRSGQWGANTLGVTSPGMLVLPVQVLALLAGIVAWRGLGAR